MNPSRVAALSALTALGLALTPIAAHAGGTTVARPLAGHYKAEEAFSSAVRSGSFVVTKNRKQISHLVVTPDTSTPSCPTAKIRVSGPLRLHKTAFQESGSPYWSVSKKTDGSIRITAHQAGETIHGTLSLGISPRNGSTHPVKYFDAQMTFPGCSFLLGGAHH
jgi:hypothetical protein